MNERRLLLLAGGINEFDGFVKMLSWNWQTARNNSVQLEFKYKTYRS